MIAKERIIKEIEDLEPEYFEEVLFFIGYLKTKQQHLISSIPETAFFSEKSLAKDWLSDEEDKAWANLVFAPNTLQKGRLK